MKYLAILRDSIREALDSKILYVNLVLTGLFLLFLSSISFRFLTVEEEMESRAAQLNTIFGLQSRNQGNKATCQLEDFAQLNDAAPREPWNGSYRFTFVLTMSEPVPDIGRFPFRSLLEQSVQQEFLRRFTSVKVKTLTPRSKREFRLGIECAGSYVTEARHWNHVPVIFFGTLPLPWLMDSPTNIAYLIQDWLVNWLIGWVIVLLGVIVTASFIPNMLRRGSVDVLLSKPIARSQLLTFKYLGGLVFVLVNAAAVIVGCYLLLGLGVGIWAHGFLLTTLLLTFFFAILYAVSTLAAVLTRSTVVCILLACLAWFAFFLVGRLHSWVSPVNGGKPDVPGFVRNGIDGLHTVLPRTRELGQLTSQFLRRELIPEAERKKVGLDEDLGTTWGEALGVSMVFIAVLLGLACWRFSRHDY